MQSYATVWVMARSGGDERVDGRRRRVCDVTFGLLHGGLAMKSTYAMYDYSLNYINLDLWPRPIHSPLTRLSRLMNRQFNKPSSVVCSASCYPRKKMFMEKIVHRQQNCS